MTEENKKDKNKDSSHPSGAGTKKPSASSAPPPAAPPAERPSPPEQATPGQQSGQQPGQPQSAQQPGQAKPEQPPGQPQSAQQPAQPKPGAPPSQGPAPKDWLRSKPVAPKHPAPAPPSGRIDLGRHDVWTNPPRPPSTGGKKKKRGGGGGQRPQGAQPPAGQQPARPPQGQPRPPQGQPRPPRPAGGQPAPGQAPRPARPPQGQPRPPRPAGSQPAPGQAQPPRPTPPGGPRPVQPGLPPRPAMPPGAVITPRPGVPRPPIGGLPGRLPLPAVGEEAPPSAETEEKTRRARSKGKGKSKARPERDKFRDDVLPLQEAAARARAGAPRGRVGPGPRLAPPRPPRPTTPRPRPVPVRPKPEAAPGVPGAPAEVAPTVTVAGNVLELPRVIVVRELAEAMEVSPVEVIKDLIKIGIIATVNQLIDFDTAAIVAADFGYEARPRVTAAPQPALAEEPEKKEAPKRRRLVVDEEGGVLRPPVVNIMGHVDHGKTSLLDAIRQTNVIATEVGGITQHIGAYQVEKNNRKITFLDTPGHEAFTAMRARGALVTDIAILVVAADDGVQAQTLEAINHARAAGVPILVALNKIDKENALPDKVKQQLSYAGLVVEEWGGDTICVPISAKRKVGIDDLLEMILLVADLHELKANPNRAASGTIVEAELDKTRGPLATVLVQQGTLRVGDNVLVGPIAGKVKAMFNDKGKSVKKAEPATPVGILGLDDVPQAGDILEVVADEKTAKERALALQEKSQRETAMQAGAARVTLEDFFKQIQAGEVKELNIVLKADVQGSIEPIVNSLSKLGDEKVKVKLLHQAAGIINESDIRLASASKAIVIGFQVRPDPAAKQLAELEGVDVRYYDIIYNLVDDVQKALTGLYEPKYADVLDGKAEVRALFKVGKGQIAGLSVTEGTIARTDTVKVLREGKEVFAGKLASLKRFKDDVREVTKGFECGLGLEGFNEFLVGDAIEAYRKERVN